MMTTKKMLIDATQAEETRVAIVEGNRLQAFDFDSASRKQLKGNLYLAKVTRVEPSLQACFVEYGGNRQGFLAFSEIHPDYYRIPVEDREALLAEEAAWDDEDHDDEHFDDFNPKSDNPEDAFAPEALATSSGVEPSYTEQPSLALLEQDQENAIQTQAFDQATDFQTDHESQNHENGIQQLEKDQTIETVGGEEEDNFEEQEQTSRRHSKLRRRYKIQEVIKRRQILLIQVTKEERGNKGAALTTYVSLPGRYSVLMPNSPRGGGISRKIANGQDRRRMRELLDELDVPAGMSVILRTAGMQRSKQEVKRDLDYLLRLWDDIRGTTMESVAPALIYEEADIFKRAVRDLYTPDIEEISVSGPRDTFLQVRDFMKLLIPSHARRVKHYGDPLVPLFQRHQVESQIDQIYSPRVDLKSGGYIIINPTEALVSIDVNSGRSTRERHIDDTALNTNLEAAEEIARQLRLRDLGGLVVIDFIDMESGRHNAKVERRLKDAMSTDRARIEIGRVSPFGLLELSRQRLHPSLTETHFECCPHCEGTGLIRTTESAAVVALRMIEDEAIKGRAVQVTASLPQQVAVYMLNHKRDALQRIDDYFGCRVAIHIDEEMKPNDVKIDFVKGTPQPRIKPQDLPAPIVDDFDDSDLPAEDEFALEQGEPLFPHLGDAAQDDEQQSSRNGRDRNNRRRRGGRNRHERGGERGERGERQPRAPHPGDGEQPVIALDGVAVEDAEANETSVDGKESNGKERREYGRRGGRNRRRGGRDRAPQQEGTSADGTTTERGETTIIPIAANADETAPAAPAFGRRPSRSSAAVAKNAQSSVAAFPAKAPAAKEPKPAQAAAAPQPAPAPKAAPVSAPQTQPAQEDDGQPKKRGWWSKLVNTESEM
jgi:ribonuclease E